MLSINTLRWADDTTQRSHTKTINSFVQRDSWCGICWQPTFTRISRSPPRGWGNKRSYQPIRSKVSQHFLRPKWRVFGSLYWYSTVLNNSCRPGTIDVLLGEETTLHAKQTNHTQFKWSIKRPSSTQSVLCHTRVLTASWPVVTVDWGSATFHDILEEYWKSVVLLRFSVKHLSDISTLGWISDFVEKSEKV